MTPIRFEGKLKNPINEEGVVVIERGVGEPCTMYRRYRDVGARGVIGNVEWVNFIGFITRQRLSIKTGPT